MDESSCENLQQSYNYENHWNNAYLKTPSQNLGWYEDIPTNSLDLINECNVDDDALIFNAGTGTSNLITKLIKNGYKNIAVNDISSAALTELRENLSISKHVSVKFILDDLTNPSELLKLKNVAIWHDRAVLHFFREEAQQKAYFDLVRKVVKVDGFAIFAEFNIDGANSCSGLKVVNYNESMLQERLGDGFELIKSFNYTYHQPSGNTREFIYTLFKRIA